ncbi:peptidase M28 [Chitinophaga parva]|uniref:Peptidase M28 n=1 Tax=Chitinophaga parva TaxID=2169414 RepID=A0A2T7BGR9_9BACT|nr:M28 family metallopeptidase [Chitinophaga parva]PUZ25474.1 peptidase M28 [Chitinophaga parva]
MKQLINSLLIGGVLAACSCNQGGAGGDASTPDSAAVREINKDAFVKQLSVLASDSFQGRKPFTPGEDLTIHYLEDQFKALGLKPGNGNSYFQEVPMVEVNTKPDGPLVIKGAKGSVSLKYLDDYVATTRRIDTTVSADNSGIVFAGFGIVAPEYKWNDYEGLDVKGKTVMVLVNDPGFTDSTLFKGHTMTYYGRWTYKYEEAARQGATGVIIVHETAPASYPWDVVRGGWSGARLELQAEDNYASRAKLEGWVTIDAAKKIFQLAGVGDSLMEKAHHPGFKPVDLHLTTSFVLHNSLKKSTSHNVVAVLPGTSKADEAVIYSAHWDHFGIGEPRESPLKPGVKDSIYNGALDNGSGTAALVVLAKAFTTAQHKPERSVVFLAVTGEEQGLLGSEYYATHPLFPINKTVADLNVDEMNNYGRTKDVVMIGYGQSDMDDYAKDAAARQGRTVVPDPKPFTGSFFRSDHFNFAKAGIPALYFEGGPTSVDHGAGYGVKMKEEFDATRYHSPFDELDSSWNFDGMIEDTQLLFSIGFRLANENSWPKWKAGSEFKAARDKNAPKE